MDAQCVLDWKLLLEYLRVLLSGPTVAGLVALAFFFAFRDDIRKLMARIATFKGAGVEVTTTQQERALEAGLAPAAAPSSSQQPPDTPPGLHLPPQEQERLRDFIRTERDRATLWEYRFLNLYLVPGTQLVLDWIAHEPGGRTTVKMFDAIWRHDIPALQERAAVLNALREHTLVNIQGALIELTDKGREYLQWRGAYRPPVPAAPMPTVPVPTTVPGSAPTAEAAQAPDDRGES